MTEVRSFDGRHVIANYWQNEDDSWVEFEGAWPEYFGYDVVSNDVAETIALIQESFDYWQFNLSRNIDLKIAEFNETKEKWI